MTKARESYKEALKSLKKELTYFQLVEYYTSVEPPKSLVEDKLEQYKRICCREQAQKITYALQIKSNLPEKELEELTLYLQNIYGQAESVAARLTKLEDIMFCGDENKRKALMQEVYASIDAEAEFLENVNPNTNYKTLHHAMVDSIFDNDQKVLQRFVILEKQDDDQEEAKEPVFQQEDLSSFPDITPEEVKEVEKINKELVKIKSGLVEFVDYFNEIISYAGALVKDYREDDDRFGVKGFSYIEKCALQARALNESILDTIEFLNERFEKYPTKTDVTVYQVMLDVAKKLQEKNIISNEKFEILNGAMEECDDEIEFAKSPEYERIKDRIDEESELMEFIDSEIEFKQGQEQMLEQLCDPNITMIHSLKLIK